MPLFVRAHTCKVPVVCPVDPETDAFADSRFTVTIWFWEPVKPVELTSQQVQERMDG